jgi:hypothetical protein
MHIPPAIIQSINYSIIINALCNAAKTAANDNYFENLKNLFAVLKNSCTFAPAKRYHSSVGRATD